VAVAVAAWIATGGTTVPRRQPGLASPTPRSRPAAPDAGAPAPPRRLASALDEAERVIDDRRSSAHALAAAALVEELATGVLERAPAPKRRAALALADRPARAAMRTNLAAAAALTSLAERRSRLPPWRIIAPPPPGRLLGIFRAAQARYRVPWAYLAAIELIESRFGRIRGPSSAGAEGPMQFLAGTWAEYGHGSIDDPRAAILAAARFLAANGAPGDMAAALFHYNNSRAYVTAVRDYARHMQQDPRAYDGYYGWQVIYAYGHRTVLLPVGFPAARPIPVTPGLAAVPGVG
jgi:transglycosylase-like protein with SLT domain